MEVEVGRLEVRSIGVGVNCIGWRQVLVRQELRDIQEPRRIDAARLDIRQDRVLVGHNAEHDLIQVGQALCCLVVLGVAHNGVVVARLALTHHEGATDN